MRRAWRFSFEEGGPQRLEIVEAEEPGLIVLFDRRVLTAAPLAFPTVRGTQLALDDGSELTLAATEHADLWVSRDAEPLTDTECDLTGVALRACKGLAFPTLMLVLAAFQGMFGKAIDLTAALAAPYLLCILMLAVLVGAGYRTALLIGAGLLVAFGVFDALYRGLSWRGLAWDAVTTVSVLLAVRGYRAMAPIQRWYPARAISH